MSQTEETIAEKRPHFGHGSSTTDIQSDAKIITKKTLYHVLIKLKKNFHHRIWNKALGAKKSKYNMDHKLIHIIQQLYHKASSAIMLQGFIGKWFHISVGVYYGCLLSSTPLTSSLNTSRLPPLRNSSFKVNIGGSITNLQFADNIANLAGKEEGLEETSSIYGVETNPT